VGAGWANADGTISIVLNTRVHLVQSPDMVLTLFPKDYRRNKLSGDYAVDPEVEAAGE